MATVSVLFVPADGFRGIFEPLTWTLLYVLATAEMLELTTIDVLFVIETILAVVAAPMNSIHSPGRKSCWNNVLVPVITFVAEAAAVPTRAVVAQLASFTITSTYASLVSDPSLNPRIPFAAPIPNVIVPDVVS